MPYSQDQDDKAMARLMTDLGRIPDTPEVEPHKRTGAGVPLCLALLMLVLAVVLLVFA